MSSPTSSLGRRAGELRTEFDQAFAEPMRLSPPLMIELLSIRAGTQAFAIRLAEISGLFADKRITSIPGSGASLLGLASFRGAILPVYDLKALLGEPGADAPRWLAIAAASPIALAFDAFDGQLRIAQDAILKSERAQTTPHAGEVVRVGASARPVISLASVLNAIKAKSAEPTSREELH